MKGADGMIGGDRYRHTADAGSVIESFFLACRSGKVSGPEHCRTFREVFVGIW